MRSHRSLDWPEIYTYRECLVQLIGGSCRLLLRLDAALQVQSTIEFSFVNGREYYHYGLLQQRNLELLVIALFHAAETSTTIPGYNQAWKSVQEVRSP